MCLLFMCKDGLFHFSVSVFLYCMSYIALFAAFHTATVMDFFVSFFCLFLQEFNK